MRLMTWELDEQLSDVRTLLALQERRRVANDCFPKIGLPTLTDLAETHHQPATNNTSLSRSDNTERMAEGVSAGVWRMVLSGGAAFTFGLIILLWSLFSNRLEWWNVGLASVLTGQSALLIGAILLVHHVRHGNRDLSAKLDATIGGLHVLRKENGIARSAPNMDRFDDRNLLKRVADIKNHIATVQHSLVE